MTILGLDIVLYCNMTYQNDMTTVLAMCHKTVIIHSAANQWGIVEYRIKDTLSVIQNNI